MVVSRFRFSLVAVFLTTFLPTPPAGAQPREDWARVYGDNPNDTFRDFCITGTGNYAVAGCDYGNSFNGWLVVTTTPERLVEEIASSLRSSQRREASVVWDARGLAAGGYVLKLEAGSHTASEKITLIK